MSDTEAKSGEMNLGEYIDSTSTASQFHRASSDKIVTLKNFVEPKFNKGYVNF